MNNTTYYYLIMSQKSLLNNEVIEELLREKATYYSVKKKQIDFWLLVSPSFIYSENLIEKIRKSNFYLNQKLLILSSDFYSKKEYNFEFFGSIISTDKEFIKWISLRIGDFEKFEEIGTLNKNYTSNGISGNLVIKESNDLSPLLNNSDYLHPSILIDRYKKSLELYYLEQNKKSLIS